MNYNEVLEWLLARLPMYQNLGNVAYKGGLHNIKNLLSHLGNPHLHFNSIHIGGTNGKGSISHMLASVLQKSGYKVGLYTSPHLIDFRERIKINGSLIPREYVVSFITKNLSFFEENHFSFFEMTAAMAFSFFKESKVAMAVIEVGLGGRLDATNIILPQVSVITNIGLDHTHILGDTLQKIAKEKSGIIKENTPVVIGEYHLQTMPVFKEKAKEKKASLYCAEALIKQTFPTDLKGNYQKKNLKTALQTLAVLQKLGYKKIRQTTIKQGLSQVVLQTGLQGRWQILQTSPKIICDIAHNTEGIFYAMQALRQEIFEKLHMVLGFVKDKDLEQILPLFPKKAYYYFCKPNLSRAMPLEKIQYFATKMFEFKNFYHTCHQAYIKALYNANAKDLIYIGGSTFVVAEILNLLCSKQPT